MMEKPEKNYENPGTWVLIWEYSARAFHWIPTWQGLDDFQKSFRPCPLDTSSLSTGRIKPRIALDTQVKVYHTTWIQCLGIGSTAREPLWPSDYGAWLTSMSLLDPHFPHSRSLYKCAALWGTVYGASAAKRPLGTICEEKGISSRFRVSISSRYELICWKRGKTPYIPSLDDENTSCMTWVPD